MNYDCVDDTVGSSLSLIFDELKLLPEAGHMVGAR